MSTQSQIIDILAQPLAAYNRRLAFFLSEDEPDTRRIAAEIVASYPWPIGVELRRLFAAGSQKPGRGRLDQLLRTMERSMQFVCFVLLAQALEEGLQKELVLSEYFKEKFRERFSSLSLGNISWLIRSLGNIYQENGLDPFMPEIASILRNDFHYMLQDIVRMRNEVSHYHVTLPQEELEIRCFKAQEQALNLLQPLAFLTSYPLVTVSKVYVRKPKRSAPSFEHQLKLLNAVSSDFIAREYVWPRFLPNNAILVLPDLKTFPDKYLNLSPLIIDTHDEILDSQEKIRGLKKDIFFYSRQDNDGLHYAGTEVRTTCDMRLAGQYSRLEQELREFYQVFAAGEDKK